MKGDGPIKGGVEVRTACRVGSDSWFSACFHWCCGIFFWSCRDSSNGVVAISVDPIKSRLLDFSDPIYTDVKGNAEYMPGSEMQAAIALSLRLAGIGGEPKTPECVICLDVFSEENPRLPTICSCGFDKSNFHKACLKRWMTKRGSCVCPSCYDELFFEDADGS